MIRFYNGKVLTFNPDPVVSSNEVWVDGSVISYVGPSKSSDFTFDREINLNGNLLIPGFKNAHTHTAMTALRSLGDNKPLDRWFNEDILPNEAKLTPDSVYCFTKLGILEYLRSGITSSFDMYIKNEAYTDANIDCGFRTVVCAGLNNYDSDIENIEREFISLNCKHELISNILGIHAEYTTCPERINYLIGLSKKYKAPCFTHLSETKNEVEGCISRYGMTPPVFLDSLGFFDYGGGGFHCVHMTDEDIDLFRNKNLFVVSNPASNLKLASGIAPVEKMRKRGIRIALGTDGASSNNSLNMFKEMYLVSTLQKYLLNDASVCQPSEVLKMACVNGADAMGLNDCNNIAIGKKADLAVIDLNTPSMQPENNILNNIVFAGSISCVKLTMVNGKVLYEDGNYYIGEDVSAIIEKCKQYSKEIRNI